MSDIGVALIGCGGIALANHVPGIRLCPQARLTALCDANAEVLARAATTTGAGFQTSDYHEVLQRSDVQAVIIATPNCFHAPIAIAAAEAGKHILCEKPLAMDASEARRMLDAAEKAGVRHMTAFTYRFVPAMHYMAHLVQSGAIGTPYHFRAQRFQDWGDRNLAWRQKSSMAGSGELGDMLSHRLDFAHLLFGPIQKLVARTRRFIDDRQGQPSDLDDWVSVMADFASGATGMLESTKLATGRGEGGRSLDLCEVNGSEGTLIYRQERPHEIEIGKAGGSGLETIPVPKDFQTWPGSQRNPEDGDPVITFRWDQDVEFIQAISENRPCRPSFKDGWQVQSIMDAALQSDRDGLWVEIPASLYA